MELEALSSIYMDDFKVLVVKPPRQFELNVWPSQAEENFIGVTLQITLPKKYPEKKPEIQVRSLKQLTSTQRSALQSIVDNQVQCAS
jgi:hypothetical protein